MLCLTCCRHPCTPPCLAGPTRGTFLLASAACQGCPRRFLGAAAGCGAAHLRLFDRRNRHALLAWRLAP